MFAGVDVVKNKIDHLVRISDAKELNQFLRTHTNVLLICARTGYKNYSKCT